jgi:hypothetical protein
MGLQPPWSVNLLVCVLVTGHAVASHHSAALRVAYRPTRDTLTASPRAAGAPLKYHFCEAC